jgi:hypothetical protein
VQSIVLDYVIYPVGKEAVTYSMGAAMGGIKALHKKGRAPRD